MKKGWCQNYFEKISDLVMGSSQNPGPFREKVAYYKIVLSRYIINISYCHGLWHDIFSLVPILRIEFRVKIEE